MPFENDFLELMVDTVLWQAFTGNTGTGYAARNYAAPKYVSAAILQDSRLVRDMQGREVVSNTHLYLPPTCQDGTLLGPLTIKDLFTLPAGYSGNLTPPIISIERGMDSGPGEPGWQGGMVQGGPGVSGVPPVQLQAVAPHHWVVNL